MKIGKTLCKIVDKPAMISALTMVCVGILPHAHGADSDDLFELSIENLMQIEVTSIARRGQILSDTSAAVYVITAEDIANSTALTIPDLLRTVPGMEVAQLDANKWAVSARGFNSRLVSKLMVVVDGRTVYSPTFGAVFWESLDLILENIDRIEIIRGPGATIWGANAVNGVVNIQTKSAHETQGLTASMLTGNQYEQILTVQQGGEINPETSYRIYGKSKKHDGFNSVFDTPAEDDWDSRQIGFRVDAVLDPRNSITFQGDAYDQDINQLQTFLVQPGLFTPNVSNPVESEGVNLVARWEHQLERGGALTTQFFYDHTLRNDLVNRDHIDTYDLDVTYTNAEGNRHSLTLGAGVRITKHENDGTPYLSHIPEDRTLKLFNISFYDDIRLTERAILGLGLKIEDNIFTGTEYQPNIRLNYSVTNNQNLWVALSRAVRTPSRGERDGLSTVGFLPALYNPVFPVDAYVQVLPNDDFDTEKLKSLEAGWRWSASNNLSFDIAAYYNRYDDLRNLEESQPYCVPDPFCRSQIDYVVQPTSVINLGEADTKGIELVSKWQKRNLSVELGYSYFEIDYKGRASAFTASAAKASNPARDEPLFKYNLQTNWQINPQMRMNLVYRYVSEPGIANIDDYHAIDVQYVWEPRDWFSLRLVGRNLDANDHFEFNSELLNAVPAVIERSVFIDARFRW